MWFYDFHTLYAAGRTIAAGRSPYDSALILQELARTGWPSGEVAFGSFFYPPWTLWLFYPLGFLSFEAAALLWSVLCLLVVWQVIVLFRRASSHDRLLNSLSPADLLFCVALFFPLSKQIIYGNTAFVTTGACCLAIHQYQRKNFIWAGFVFSFALLKPQLIVVLALALSFHALRRRRFSFFTGAILGLSVQMLLSYAVLPVSLQIYEAMPSFWEQTAIGYHASIPQYLARISGSGFYRMAALPVALLAGLYLGKDRFVETRSSWTLLLPLSLLLAPYAWSHDFLLLIVPFLFLCVWGFEKIGRRITLIVLGLQYLLSFALVAKPGWEQYLLLYPAAVLVLSLWRGNAPKQVQLAAET